MGLFARQIEDDIVMPILAFTNCDYKVPLTYSDDVVVGARTVKVGRSSFTQKYRVFSTARNCVSALGQGTVVCVDKKTGKPVPVPDDIRGKIERVEQAA